MASRHGRPSATSESRVTHGSRPRSRNLRHGSASVQEHRAGAPPLPLQGSASQPAASARGVVRSVALLVAFRPVHRFPAPSRSTSRRSSWMSLAHPLVFTPLSSIRANHSPREFVARYDRGQYCFSSIQSHTQFLKGQPIHVRSHNPARSNKSPTRCGPVADHLRNRL